MAPRQLAPAAATDRPCHPIPGDKTMRRFAPLLPAVMLLGLAACGGAGLTGQQPQRPAAPPVAYNPPPQTLTQPESDVRWHQVRFATASTRLTEGDRATIREVATAMGNENALRATVIGRADPVGRDQANMRLSRQRAMAVRDALVREGVARDRIDTRWTGDRRPPAAQGPASTEEGGDRVVDIALQRRGQAD
ncbi:MAG TPA: OmpA family protein [Roseococcus sp.]|jgi:outer membrane protein OmpA-like peptidoglycan-associated protein|nr:OmpA family protein [Roseococcus sp.]